MTGTTPPIPDHGEIRGALGAFALDAVDGEERQRLAAHVATCASCRDELAVLVEAAARIVDTEAPGPGHVWAGIATSLTGAGSIGPPPAWETIAGRLDRPDAGTPVGTGPRPSASDPTGRRRWPLRAALALAAALALVVAGVGVHAAHLQQRVSALESGGGLTHEERAALGAPGTRRVVLTASSASVGIGPRVTVVLPRSGPGFVEAGSLRALPAGRTYQLWGITDGRAVSLGVLGSDPDVVAVAFGGRVPGELAITDEASGGAPQPTSTPLLSGAPV